ncbi:A1S_2505 family phage non-structural protein [Photobacterium kishitanii]|uniref:Uncharacterized protein n=1 Tax=Photobacterium kishitanii TaxID=318456 RepID=A0A2T3KA02_9GAMM|nr:hypothetical protein [Photobacterium kishitanii]PSU87815.1 hypothetical protein C9J27_25990 [Photobacterium kishitanii]
MKFWKGDAIGKPKAGIHDNVIIIASSNPSGKHGKGIAHVAMLHWGAKYGVGRGLSGKSYLLPTKNLIKDYYEESTGITYRRYGKRSLTKAQIRSNIVELYHVAETMKDKKFIVCYKKGDKNLNGYSDIEMFKLFTDEISYPINIIFHESWKNTLLT